MAEGQEQETAFERSVRFRRMERMKRMQVPEEVLLLPDLFPEARHGFKDRLHLAKAWEAHGRPPDDVPGNSVELLQEVGKLLGRDHVIRHCKVQLSEVVHALAGRPDRGVRAWRRAVSSSVDTALAALTTAAERELVMLRDSDGQYLSDLHHCVRKEAAKDARVALTDELRGALDAVARAAQQRAYRNSKFRSNVAEPAARLTALLEREGLTPGRNQGATSHDRRHIALKALNTGDVQLIALRAAGDCAIAALADVLREPQYQHLAAVVGSSLRSSDRTVRINAAELALEVESYRERYGIKSGPLLGQAPEMRPEHELTELPASPEAARARIYSELARRVDDAAVASPRAPGSVLAR